MHANEVMSRSERREARKWASVKIVPWEKTATTGPSREQWEKWNNEHGAMLRIACATMALNKNELADAAAVFDDDIAGWDELQSSYDRSIAFFKDMAKTIEAAQLRFLVGAHVHLLRMEEGKPSGKRKVASAPARQKPELKLVKSEGQS
jgi:hypothetical protein